MKYIKFFEVNIKHSHHIAMDHPLNDFSRKLEDIIIEIKKLDNYDKINTVRRYFTDYKEIHINYNNDYRGRLLKISLQVVNDDILMDVICYKSSKEDEINTSLEFYNFCKNILSDFVTIDRNRFGKSQLQLIFSIDNKDKILNDIEYFFTSKKYNL